MTGPRFAVTGRLGELPDQVREALVARRDLAGDARDAREGKTAAATSDPTRDRASGAETVPTGPADGLATEVARLLARVRCEGDVALRAFARDFDAVALDALEVPRADWEAARAALDPVVRGALERAARNIAEVHAAFAPVAQERVTADGVTIGRRPDPLPRVGVYAPGGRAAYPSSLLMGAVPARVAGVGEVIVCTPPARDGRPDPVLLAAAAIAGVDRVFAVGGAGAIGAMAFGTATIPAVDRIVGPGNAWVAEAKRQVASVVGIDSPAGPSELLVLAGPGADPGMVADELLAQAEHDPEAACVLLVLADAFGGERASGEARAAEGSGDAPDICARATAFITAVARALEARWEELARRDVISAAFASRGALLVADTATEALAFITAYAPEHLLLVGAGADDPSLLARVRGAGTVFLGNASSVAFGDYLTGANHVLPTAGAGRRYSGLSTLDFVRWTTWQRVGPEAAARLAADTVALATAEGLPGHAAAAARWRAA